MSFYEPTETLYPREGLDSTIDRYPVICYFGLSHSNLYSFSSHMDVHSLP